LFTGAGASFFSGAGASFLTGTEDPFFARILLRMAALTLTSYVELAAASTFALT
jgi:hypothetical protein